jgi:hypothetical protein
LADQIVISTLAFLHIVSAIAWFGGVVFFISSVAPGLRSLSPGARIEFSAKVGPRLIRFFVISATLTIVFGLSLLFEAFGGNTAAWPQSIEIGFSFGFLAYLVALVVTVPASRRLDKISQGLLNNPNAGPPPPEFAKNFKTLGRAAVLVAILLLLATIFMVGTAFPL